MTKREKIGLAALLGLFALMISAFVWAFREPSSKGRSFEDSAIVRQRIINVQKSK